MVKFNQGLRQTFSLSKNLQLELKKKCCWAFTLRYSDDNTKCYSEQYTGRKNTKKEQNSIPGLALIRLSETGLRFSNADCTWWLLSSLKIEIDRSPLSTHKCSQYILGTLRQVLLIRRGYMLSRINTDWFPERAPRAQGSSRGVRGHVPQEISGFLNHSDRILANSNFPG